MTKVQQQKQVYHEMVNDWKKLLDNAMTTLHIAQKEEPTNGLLDLTQADLISLRQRMIHLLIS